VIHAPPACGNTTPFEQDGKRNREQEPTDQRHDLAKSARDQFVGNRIFAGRSLRDSGHDSPLQRTGMVLQSSRTEA
jgi:hypothetical protein